MAYADNLKVSTIGYPRWTHNAIVHNLSYNIDFQIDTE